jgi:hypothetical protein
MKRASSAAVLALLLGACASKAPPLSGRYLIVVDPSVGSYAGAIQRAFSERLTNVRFAEALPIGGISDAIVIIRGVGCLSRFDSAGCGPAPPSAFAYEIYRGGRLVDSGRASATFGYDNGAYGSRSASFASENSGSYVVVATNGLASDVARSLSR